MTPYDHLPPGSPPSGETGSAEPPALKRSGSQKRQRCKKLEIVLTPEQYADVRTRATAAGLSASAWGFAVIFGSPHPRARRTPTVNAALLGDAIGQLMRSANVLNQFLPYLHGGRAITLGRACLEALLTNRRAADAILEALGRKEQPGNDNQGEPAR